MIEKNKQTLELPKIGYPYVGKHGEKLFVESISNSIYGNPELLVHYTIIGLKFTQQSMELSRFMKWATDDLTTPPQNKASFNPYLQAKKIKCKEGENDCSKSGWEIDGKFYCDYHYVVAERHESK